jgi:hypothetical protein
VVTTTGVVVAAEATVDGSTTANRAVSRRLVRGFLSVESVEGVEEDDAVTDTPDTTGRWRP